MTEIGKLESKFFWSLYEIVKQNYFILRHQEKYDIFNAYFLI